MNFVLKNIYRCVSFAACISFFLYTAKMDAALSPQNHLRSSSIPETVATAYNYRSSLQALDYTIDAAHKQLAVDLSGYLPHISTEISFTKFPNVFSSNLFSPTTALTKTNKIFNLSCDLLLLDFAGPYAHYKISKQKIDIAQLHKESHKKRIRFEVEQTALNSWALKQKEKTIAALDNASIFSINNAKESKNIGLIDITQWSGQCAAFKQSGATIENYHEQVQQTLDTLNSFIESPTAYQPDDYATHDFIATAIEQAQQHPVEHYLELAYKNRSSLAIQDVHIKISCMEQSLLKKSYIPTVSLSVQVAKNSHDHGKLFISRFDKVAWGVFTNITWNFDGGTNAFKADQANAQILAAQSEKRALQVSITNEVQTTYYDLQQLLEQRNAQKTALLDAQTKYKRKQIEFETGLLSSLEQAQVDLDWANARFNFINIEVATAKKYRELLFVSGYPSHYI
ncbi:MAG TPA: TolC family protein [Candidatus Babeliales bacterium]|nr:TolC family protein [Candidatus Babeliales bacterium]